MVENTEAVEVEAVRSRPQSQRDERRQLWRSRPPAERANWAVAISALASVLSLIVATIGIGFALMQFAEFRTEQVEQSRQRWENSITETNRFFIEKELSEPALRCAYAYYGAGSAADCAAQLQIPENRTLLLAYGEEVLNQLWGIHDYNDVHCKPDQVDVLPWISIPIEPACANFESWEVDIEQDPVGVFGFLLSKPEWKDYPVKLMTTDQIKAGAERFTALSAGNTARQ